MFKIVNILSLKIVNFCRLTLSLPVMTVVVCYCCLCMFLVKVSIDAKIRNRYNQVPHLTQDTNGKVANSQLDTTNESQEVSPFPAGDHKAHINRRQQRHSKHSLYCKQYGPRSGFILFVSINRSSLKCS